MLVLGGAGLALHAEDAGADLTFRRAVDALRWPLGTDTVRVRIVDGQVLVPTTLRSASGESVSGLLTLDTGAPVLALRRSVWDQLKVDTLALHGSYWSRVHRPLAWVEMGTARLPDLWIEDVYADSLFPDELGLFAPFLLVDRALVLGYADSVWAMVPPRFSVLPDDSATASETSIDRQARIRRSRSAYAAILDSASIAGPFRLYDSRILIDARVSRRIRTGVAGWSRFSWTRELPPARCSRRSSPSASVGPRRGRASPTRRCGPCWGLEARSSPCFRLWISKARARRCRLYGSRPG